MRIRNAVAAATTAAIPLAMLAATSPADAATPSCGQKCVNVFSKQFGPHFVLDVQNAQAVVGQPIILFQGSNRDGAQDFTYSFQGTVDDFYNLDLVSGAVELHYAHNPAFEIEYSPYGKGSNLCVGTATRAVSDSWVSLQPCGKSAKTVWIVTFSHRGKGGKGGSNGKGGKAHGNATPVGGGSTPPGGGGGSTPPGGGGGGSTPPGGGGGSTPPGGGGGSTPPGGGGGSTPPGGGGGSTPPGGGGGSTPPGGGGGSTPPGGGGGSTPPGGGGGSMPPGGGGGGSMPPGGGGGGSMPPGGGGCGAPSHDVAATSLRLRARLRLHHLDTGMGRRRYSWL